MNMKSKEVLSLPMKRGHDGHKNKAQGRRILKKLNARLHTQ